MRISVLLEMLTGQFETDVKRAEKQFARSMKDMEEKAKRAGVALGVGLAAAGTAVGAVVAAAIQDANRIDEVAQRIGLTTEALSRLRFAAAQNGSTLEALQAGFGRLAKEADSGGKNLQRLGISARDSAGNLRPLEELFLDVADRVSQYSNQTDRLAAAQAVFGRGAVELLPVLAQGRDGLQELGDKAERLGLVIDSNTAAASARLNNNISTLKTTVTAFGLGIAETVLPALVNLSETLVAGSEKTGGLAAAGRAVGDAIVYAAGLFITGKAKIEQFTVVVAFTVDAVSTMIDSLMDLGSVGRNAFSALAAAARGDLQGTADQFAAMQARARELGEDLGDKLRAKVEAGAQAIRDIDQAAEDAIGALNRNTDAVESATVAASNSAGAFLQSADALKLQEDAAKAGADALERLGGIIDRQNAARGVQVQIALEFRDTMVDLYAIEQQLIASGMMTEQLQYAINEARKIATQTLKEETAELLKNRAAKQGAIEQQPKQYQQSWGDAIRSVIRGFDDWLRSGLRNGDALLRGLKGVADKLKDAFARAFDPENLGETITNGLDLIAQMRFDSQNNPDGYLRTLTNPAVSGDIGRAIQALDSIFGGRLLGTAYQPSRSGVNVAIGAGGATGSTFMEEVRQRSFFRGRQWRTTTGALDAGAEQAIDAIFASIRDALEAGSRELGVAIPNIIGGSFSEVRDAQGNITSQQSVVNGRVSNEDLQAFGRRLLAENLLAVLQQDETFRNVGNIAERWRGDAATLLEGVQFLMTAARDLQRGVNLLGGGAGITELTDFIEGFQRAGESLSATYARVTDSTRILESAVSIMGANLGLARDAFITFAVDITDAAGGVRQAASLWDDYFNTFYSQTERLEAQVASATESANTALSRIGLNLADFSGADGLARFRAQFEAALPTLTPEQVVQWLEASRALGNLSRSARALAESVDLVELDDIEAIMRAIEEEIAGIMEDVNAQIESLTAPQTYAERIAQVNEQIAALVARAVELGATEEQIARIRELGALRIQEILAEQARELADIMASVDEALSSSRFVTGAERIAAITAEFEALIERATALGATEVELARIRELAAIRLSEVLNEQAAAMANLADVLAVMAAEQGGGISPLTGSLRGLRSQYQQQVDTINELARASGRAGASTAELAMAQRWYQVQVSRLVAQLLERARGIIGQLYGGAGGGSETQSVVNADAGGIGDVRDAMEDRYRRELELLGNLRDFLESLGLSELSPLTPGERLAEAQAIYERTLAAAQGGDLDALANLPEAARQFLGEAQGFFGGVGAYTDIFASVRAALEEIAARNPTAPGGTGTGGGGGGGLVVEAGESFARLSEIERFALASELSVVLRDIIGATGTNLATLAEQLGLDLVQFLADLGVRVDELTVTSSVRLADIARSLGVELTELAASVGADLGALADRQSLLNDALETVVGGLPEEFRGRLQDLLRNIEDATTEADARAAVAAAEQEIAALPPFIRDALAPFFDGISSPTDDLLATTIEQARDVADIRDIAADILELMDPEIPDPVPSAPMASPLVAQIESLRNEVAGLRADARARASDERADMSEQTAQIKRLGQSAARR